MTCLIHVAWPFGFEKHSDFEFMEKSKPKCRNAIDCKGGTQSRPVRGVCVKQPCTCRGEFFLIPRAVVWHAATDCVDLCVLSVHTQVAMIPPEASSLANEANALFVDEDFDSALDLYSQAIETSPQCAELYVLRAAVHLKTENFTSAIADSNKAISLDPNNSKAYLRKGIACFNMEEYGTAKNAFEKGRDLDGSNTQFKTWIRKCNAELEEEMVGDDSAQEALPAYATTASSAQAPSQIAAAVPAPKPVQRFRHDFIQNQTMVTVTVYIKGATKESCEVTFEPTALSLDWNIGPSDSWQLNFDPLFDEIVPEESSTSFYPTKVELKMKKKNQMKWDALERKADEKALDELTEEVSAKACEM
jgi:tetratricopeptide (TPR) repeat protein